MSNVEKDSYKNINQAKKQNRKEWKDKKTLKKLKKEITQDEMTKNMTIEPTIDVKIPSTISIAVPGSILDNAQSPELRTYLAGQLARAACIFQVDEVIVFDDYEGTKNEKKVKVEDVDGVTSASHCCSQLARILQYLECPQYLRKLIFPIHHDLKFAGILNPLDAPHHLRQSNDFIFREGVITNKPVKEGKGSFVNVGLLQDVCIDKALNPGLRVTVRLLPVPEGSKKQKGEIVSPYVPRAETGVYWGYTVRIANSISQIFSQSPYKNGYDVTIGTSDKGSTVDEAACSSYDHALIVFGGLQGLESALENDEILTTDNPADLFDLYLNTLPNQGSRTIRTEEAVIITLTALRTKLIPKTKPVLFVLE